MEVPPFELDNNNTAPNCQFKQETCSPKISLFPVASCTSAIWNVTTIQCCDFMRQAGSAWWSAAGKDCVDVERQGINLDCFSLSTWDLMKHRISIDSIAFNDLEASADYSACKILVLFVCPH